MGMMRVLKDFLTMMSTYSMNDCTVSSENARDMCWTNGDGERVEALHDWFKLVWRRCKIIKVGPMGMVRVLKPSWLWSLLHDLSLVSTRCKRYVLDQEGTMRVLKDLLTVTSTPWLTAQCLEKMQDVRPRSDERVEALLTVMSTLTDCMMSSEYARDTRLMVTVLKPSIKPWLIQTGVEKMQDIINYHG
jgi:hypothetical protein